MLAPNSGEDAITPTASPLDNRLTGNNSSNNSSNNTSTTTDQLQSSLRRNNSGGSSFKGLRLGSGALHNNGNSGSSKNALSMLRHTASRGGEETPPPSPSVNSQGRPSLRIHVHSNNRGSFYGGHQVQVNSQSGRPLGVLRRTNVGKSLSRKKRVIQMLRVVCDLIKKIFFFFHLKDFSIYDIKYEL